MTYRAWQAATAAVALVSGAASAAAPAAAPAAASGAPADTVLLHGRVITVDARDSVAQALAIRAGRIVAVGTDAAINKLVGAKTRVIDLKGRAATPGLIDTHAHILEVGANALFDVDLVKTTSVAAIVALVKARVATTPNGNWVTGAGWDEGKLAGGAYPTAADLDAVSPDNPVWLENTTGHYGVANSRALALAGVTAGMADPKAGTIERLADGSPAGVLKETAQDLVHRKIPPLTVEQRRAALKHAFAALNAEGMTGFKDPRLDDIDWAAYRSLAAENAITANACVLFGGGVTLASAKQGLGWAQAAQKDVAAIPGTTLGVCGIKLFMDGSGAAPTAWMYQEWNKARTGIATGNSGYPQIDPQVYRQQVDLIVGAGMGIGTHAIGDRAIDWVVDSYDAALKATGKKGLRLSIIHANIPTDHAIDVMARLQKEYDSAYPESQAGFAWWIGDIYAANLGEARSQRLNPFKTYLAKGVIWGGGSDAPVTPFPARYGLWASTARETARGTFGATPFGTAEAVDIHTALRSYTAWAARQIDAEKRTGTLEVGKSADIAIWDRDPYAVPTAAIKDMACDMTLFQGRVVFERAKTSDNR
jgi:predicted amidohydrolase YtcJ